MGNSYYVKISAYLCVSLSSKLMPQYSFDMKNNLMENKKLQNAWGAHLSESQNAHHMSFLKMFFKVSISGSRRNTSPIPIQTAPYCLIL